jgi:hypothetical protein
MTYMQELGIRIHPREVTDAWYAANCPPNFKPNVPFLTWAQWRLSCLLRGAKWEK